MEYRKITFLPHGSKRRRTCWAIKIKEANGLCYYKRCDKEGQSLFDVNPTTSRTEIIITGAHEVIERPAVMNLHYGELEVVTLNARPEWVQQVQDRLDHEQAKLTEKTNA